MHNKGSSCRGPRNLAYQIKITCIRSLFADIFSYSEGIDVINCTARFFRAILLLDIAAGSKFKYAAKTHKRLYIRQCCTKDIHVDLACSLLISILTARFGNPNRAVYMHTLTYNYLCIYTRISFSYYICHTISLCVYM